MITFFYSTQTCSTAVHIALEEAGLPFKGIEVSWKRKLNVSELGAVNPLGQVPVIVDGSLTLNQCIAILEYIAEKAPAKNLFPTKGSKEYFMALSWLSFIGADFQKSFAPMIGASRWTSNVAAQTEIKAAVATTIQKHLTHIDNSLQGKDFILGSNYSLVDAYLFTIIGWCKWAEIKTSTYKNITSYLERIYARATVKKVLTAEEMLDFFPS